MKSATQNASGSPGNAKEPAKRRTASAAPVKTRKRMPAEGFRSDESATLGNYLRHPTSTGYWRLTASKSASGKFLEYIFSRNNCDISTYQIEITDKSYGLSDDHKILQITRLTTFLSAINAASLRQQGHNLEVLLKADDHGIRSAEYFDADEVLEKFPDSVRVFNDRITHTNFSSFVVRRGCLEVKSGTLMLLSDWHLAEVVFVAVAREPLAAIAELLESADLINGAHIERIFAPEEELLSPYFEFLKLGHDAAIRDKRLRPQLETAFEYFEKSDFTHTISTLGIIAEDYLTQISEYYLRAPSPKGSTLGQLYDHLHNNIREILAPKPLELANIDDTYKNLTAIQKKYKESATTSTPELIATLREVLNIIKSDRKYFSDRIDSSTRQPRRISVFPDWLHENLMELIRNRNAASHKTRIPLGRFEALRTIYCLSAFALWWREEKDRTDWELSLLEILKAAIAK